MNFQRYTNLSSTYMGFDFAHAFQSVIELQIKMPSLANSNSGWILKSEIRLNTKGLRLPQAFFRLQRLLTSLMRVRQSLIRRCFCAYTFS